MTWGHAYPEYAVMMAKAAGVKRVALFHHAPDATDEALDALGAFWAHHREPEVFLAKEGLVMDLSG
jgi:ribonuclease BN (tRNA processing enzyme)